MIRSAPLAISLMIADVLAQDRARVAGMAALALIAALVEGFGFLALVPVATLAVSRWIAFRWSVPRAPPYQHHGQCCSCRIAHRRSRAAIGA